MTDMDELNLLYDEAKSGARISLHLSPYRTLRAVWLALLWARVGGAPAALRWLKGKLDE